MEPSEKTSVKQLQDMVREGDWENKDMTIFENESYLYILLRAHKMNFKKSKEVLTQIISWRHKFGLDSVRLEDLSPQMEYQFGFLTNGKTHSGVPCFYQHMSLSGYARMFKKCGYDKAVQFLALKLKEVEEQVIFVENSGKIFDSSSYEVQLIMDGNGFTLRDVPSFKLMWDALNASRELYNHFPLFASSVVTFINLNKWTEVSLKISKPFLEATGFKVVVHGTNEDKWSSYIDELLGMGQLRRFQATAQEYNRKCNEFSLEGSN